MPASINPDDYAVEIRVQLPDGKWSYGSGYLIGPCRILTALHVIVGEKAVRDATAVSPLGDIEVRAYGDFAERFGTGDPSLPRYLEHIRTTAANDFLWRHAQLLWPNNGSRMPARELAVLKVVPEDALKPRRLQCILHAPRVSCLRPTANLRCRGTGFPEWTTAHTRDGVDLSSPTTVTGTLTLGPPSNESFHKFTAENGAPKNADEWKGLSGAAFISEDGLALVAVASAILPTSVNDDLWVTRLADLADEKELAGFWTASGLTHPDRAPKGTTASQRLQVDPLEYLHEFDRGPESDDVFDVFQPPEAPWKDFDPNEVKKPSIFIIAGRRQDIPEKMVRRIQEQIAPDFMGFRAGGPVSLSWRYSENAAQGIRGLQREMARGLSAKPPPPGNLSGLSKLAVGVDWSLDINVSEADHRDVEALSEFLSAFATFEQSGHPPGLYVSLTAGTTEVLARQDSRIESFVALLKQRCLAFTEKVLWVHDIYLDNCKYEDIKHWGDLLGGICKETAQICRDELEEYFQSEPIFALEAVKQCLSRIPIVR